MSQSAGCFLYHSLSLLALLCFYQCCLWRLLCRTATQIIGWDKEKARKGAGVGVVVVVVRGAGLVVYQVGNTEANELPGLSGLASRQCTVAHIQYDCSHHTKSPLFPSLCFLFSLSFSFPYSRTTHHHPEFPLFWSGHLTALNSFTPEHA